MAIYGLSMAAADDREVVEELPVNEGSTHLKCKMEK
jgi:hypothetical protein